MTAFGFDMLKTVVFLIFTAMFAFEDIKRKSISARGLIIFWGFGVSFAFSELLLAGYSGGAFYMRDISECVKYIKPAFISFIFPAVLIFLSLATKEAIGLGDSLYFLASSLFLDASENLMLFMISVILCAFSGLFMTAACMIRHKSPRGRSFPFMAFVLPSGIGISLLSG